MTEHAFSDDSPTVFSRLSPGMLIFGGGLVKHHICNANLMRNGAHYSVFVNTGQDFDGSDAVRPPCVPSITYSR